MSSGALFLSAARQIFSDQQSRIKKSCAQISDEELHRNTGGDGNSIAVLIQHLHGNIVSRFTDFLTTDGEKPYRQRDAEFEDRQLTRADLLSLLDKAYAL